MTATTNQEEWTSKTRKAGEPVVQLWADPDFCPCLTRSPVKECFNEAKKTPEKQTGGGDPSGCTQQKPLSRPNSLSTSTQDWGGKEKKRERGEQQRKRDPTHTHTLAHTSVPVKPEWRDNKVAGR